MAEKVIVITGATDGLGRVLATRLAADPDTRFSPRQRHPDATGSTRACA